MTKPTKFKTAKKEERVICPHCGVVADDDHEIIISGKLGRKFSLLLENDRNKMGIFLCDGCGEMFQLPFGSYIRIVK